MSLFYVLQQPAYHDAIFFLPLPTLYILYFELGVGGEGERLIMFDNFFILSVLYLIYCKYLIRNKSSIIFCPKISFLSCNIVIFIFKVSSFLCSSNQSSHLLFVSCLVLSYIIRHVLLYMCSSNQSSHRYLLTIMYN